MNSMGHSDNGWAREPPAVRLPQPVGLRLEALKASGLSDHAIIRALQRADAETLRRVVPEEPWDWDILLRFAESDWDDCVRAIREGYVYRYLTIRGLKHLLRYRYRLKEGEDYLDRGTHLEQVKLNPRDLPSLRATLSAHWSVVEPESRKDGETIAVTIRWAHDVPEP
jgi:hypothetical protein